MEVCESRYILKCFEVLNNVLTSCIGINLANLAAQEDSARANSRRTSSLSRQLYIHSLTYIIRGLPSNLSPDERISIFSSLPPEVRDISQNLTRSDGFGHRSSTAIAENGQSEEEPSLLHRALAAFVVRMFIIIQLLLPYLRVWFAAAYRYERQHHISERTLSSSVDTMQSVMKNSVQFGNAVCRMNDGKVGQAINDVLIWWAKGVSGGIYQGVGEGLVILGVDGPANTAGKQRIERVDGKRVD